MSSKPAGYSPATGTVSKNEKAAGIQWLFLTFRSVEGLRR